jgi:FtsP/CotA-like multicopper oxidase with cupredoxin domain
MTRAIQPGHHHLRVDNTWNKKNLEFDAAAGEEVKFRVVNRAGRFTWFLVASLGAGPMYVSIERDA